MDYSELIKDFLDDGEEHLNAFDGALMSLDRSGFSRDVVASAMGPLHTLKGNAGMMGLESLKDYIHLNEEVLKRVSDGGIRPEEATDVLLNSATTLRTALRAIGKDPSLNPDLTVESMALTRYLDGSHPCDARKSADLFSYLGVKTDTIRVDFTRLDALLNLAGELLIVKTGLNQIAAEMRAGGENKAIARELGNGLELMGKTISGLQEGIMKARMLPVSHVFSKFPRMVRDLSKLQGKDIRLVFEGEDTELDKTVIDELEEPLLHIIRNAIDHGVEAPAERIAKGKPTQGTIVLSAAQESSYVIISVKDDGQGINFERVREKGIRNGLIAKDDAIDKDKMVSLVFSAGFSTKDEATDISGRGIGLDVVSRNMTKLNGQISVDSIDGKGTTFTIKLPLSLAIIPALMAEAGGEVYAIPLSAVDESIKVGEGDIHLINNREVTRFRERVVPVVRLDEFLGLRRQSKGRFYLVIIGRAEKSLALAVDRLVGQQEIVIKPLDDTFGKSYGIAGASILGNGRIVLILDVMSLWNDGKMKRETSGVSGQE